MDHRLSNKIYCVGKRKEKNSGSRSLKNRAETQREKEKNAGSFPYYYPFTSCFLFTFSTSHRKIFVHGRHSAANRNQIQGSPVGCW